MTGLDLIASSFRSIGVFSSGEAIPGPDANDALVILNQMLDAWGAQRLVIFTIQRSVFAPASLKQAYTIGAGGDYNVARPPRISKYGVITNPGAPVASQLELPLEPYDAGKWAQIPVKGTSAAYPKIVWDDNNFPLRTVSYWPIPTTTINFTFYVWQAISQFVDLVTDYTFPPGYLEAIRYNLGKRLGIEWKPDPERLQMVNAMAAESLKAIKSFNTPQTTQRADGALLNTESSLYNWITDEPVGR